MAAAVLLGTRGGEVGISRHKIISLPVEEEREESTSFILSLGCCWLARCCHLYTGTTSSYDWDRISLERGLHVGYLQLRKNDRNFTNSTPNDELLFSLNKHLLAHLRNTVWQLISVSSLGLSREQVQVQESNASLIIFVSITFYSTHVAFYHPPYQVLNYFVRIKV